MNLSRKIFFVMKALPFFSVSFNELSLEAFHANMERPRQFVTITFYEMQIIWKAHYKKEKINLHDIEKIIHELKKNANRNRNAQFTVNYYILFFFSFF